MIGQTYFGVALALWPFAALWVGKGDCDDWEGAVLAAISGMALALLWGIALPVLAVAALVKWFWGRAE